MGVKDTLKNEIIREKLMHKQRVSLKLSNIANDIAARGRRHDNSYSETTEMELCIKIKESDTAKDNERYNLLLKQLHGKNNDYMPVFFNGDISKMNMLQLLELVADCVAKCDKDLVELEIDFGTTDSMIDFYHKYVKDELPNISDDLDAIIRNTIEYMIDRNGAILKSLPKDGAEYGDMPTIEGGLNYGA